MPRTLRRGQFTYYFHESLRQAGTAGGDWGNLQVFQYVQQRLSTFNHNRPSPSERQEPVMQSDEPEGLIFGLYRKRDGYAEKATGTLIANGTPCVLVKVALEV